MQTRLHTILILLGSVKKARYKSKGNGLIVSEPSLFKKPIWIFYHQVSMITKTSADRITLTKTAYAKSTKTKTIPIIETFTEIKTMYHTRMTEIAEERPSITLMALTAVVISGTCLLTALALLLRKRGK